MPASRSRNHGLTVIKRPGSPFFYLRGTVKGRRVFESLGTDDPALAEEARAQREAELYRSAILGTKPRVTFAAAVVSYLEAEARPASTKAYLNRLLRHFGGVMACQDIDQVVMDRACQKLCRADAQPATKLRNVITPTRAVLMHAALRGWCGAPVFQKSRGSKPRTGWLTPAEAEAMIATAAGDRAHMRRHMGPLLTFLFCTGARLGEAIALDWQDVDLQHARAVLRDTKSGLDRLVDLPTRAVADLANLAHREGAVFLAQGKALRRTDDSRTTPYGGQIKRAWAACLKDANITRKLTPHHARHSWASWHYGVHKDLLRLKSDGGWASVSQVERYAKLVPAGMEIAVLVFWNGAALRVKAAPPEHKKSA